MKLYWWARFNLFFQSDRSLLYLYKEYKKSKLALVEISQEVDAKEERIEDLESALAKAINFVTRLEKTRVINLSKSWGQRTFFVERVG